MQQKSLTPLFQRKKLTASDIQRFQNIILSFYLNHGRPFPWRNTHNPYHILVSEMMLQQTQTDRVVPKYEQFIQRFPDIDSLADAAFKEVFLLWQGLGYNRRALALHKTAILIRDNYHGTVPTTVDKLCMLPGLGPYSARAILAFAYNQPTVFIETNIRNVYTYFFFQDATAVHDKELEPLIEKTLYAHDPRTWYYALMDYGVMLKKKYPYLNKKSKHYLKQSRFQGSNRQIRGMILKTFLTDSELNVRELHKKLSLPLNKIEPILVQLVNEGLLIQKDHYFTLPESNFFQQKKI